MEFRKKLIKSDWSKYDSEVYFENDYVQVWIDRKIYREIMKLQEKYGLNGYPTPFIVRAFLYSAFKHKRHTIFKRLFRDLFFGGKNA